MAASNAAAVTAFFAPGGALAGSVAGYEPREGQVVLAQAVADALCAGEQLVAEAGTGIGKTLAYLVPSVLLGRRVLISTATKALQSQLLRDDVPSLAAALGRPIEVVALKGRLNYLCERRAEAAFIGGSTIPSEASKIAAVAAWRRETTTGDRAECTALTEADEALWRRLTASSEQCVGRRCSFYERCWLVKARNGAQEAAITVVNHHLFFADAALQSREVGDGDGPVSLLPAAEALVFDEAHELADIATQHFGAHVQRSELAYLLGDIARYAVDNDKPTLSGLASRCLSNVEAALATLPSDAPRTPLSLSPESLLRSDRQQAADAAHHSLLVLAQQLAEQKSGEPLFWSRRLLLLSEQLALCFGLMQEPAGHPLVRWCEQDEHPGPQGAQGPQGNHGRLARIVARPLAVADLLKAAIGNVPAVFLSATLRTSGSFDHIKAQLGAPAARELLVDSPFDWQRQATLYLPHDLPLPGTAEFEALAAERAAELVVQAGGGAFVLCTSRRATIAMHAALKARFDGRLLVQGQAPKESLLAAFVADGNAALVATLGFWRGVDVRGSALRLVILDRIPFAPPSDPMVAARIAQIEASGQSGFAQVQLPQAALLLRQGAGRLLRSKVDRGVIAILDPRMTGRSYGRALLRSLPPCSVVTSRDEVASALIECRPQAQAIELPALQA